MRLQKYLGFTFLFLFVCGFSNAALKERIWISFLTGFSEKYLMQIDPLGNILLPPVEIQGIPMRIGDVTALSFNGDTALNLWLLNDRLYRATIDKKTLKTVRFVQTNLKSFPIIFPSLEVTNRNDNNFVAFAVETNQGIQIAAYPINESGGVIGKRRFISPPLSSLCDGPRCNGGMAGNGRLSYWMDINPTKENQIDLFIRTLGPSAFPVKDPVFIDSIVKRSSRGFSIFNSSDATGILHGRRRFLVYIENDTRLSAPPLHRLLLQQIDADTGKEVGELIILHRAELISGNVKIDPLGRFVLFSSNFGQFGERLGYLALDSNGRASGSPKVLTDLGISGIDLLREKL